MTSLAYPSPDIAAGHLTIDLGALAANWRLMKARAGAAECGAVVKANAYGIGTEQAVRALHEAGCRTFFVAHLSEGRRVRSVASDATIYILNGYLPGTRAAYVVDNLRPVLGSREEVDDWLAKPGRDGAALPYALHVDTAMNRLGLRLEELEALAPTLGPAARPSLLMSHFSSAENTDDPATARQIALFALARALLPGVSPSLCNSSGLVLPDAPAHALARPGYALYGGNPSPGTPNPMRPVVRLESRIIQVRRVPAGESVGYNGQWTARRDSLIAVIGTGYADGYPRAAGATDAKLAAGTPCGAALVGGVTCPFAGRVSMDLITIDVTDVPSMPRRSDMVTLIGDELDIDEVGRRAGTIGYEILTSLGDRYPRTYLAGSHPESA